MTTVEKEQFWTQIVENPSLWGTIQTSDKSFNTQAENIWTVMNETFIKNGSLKEVNRWELMLGDRLENSGEGTLNERKARILKRITEHPPVSIKILEGLIKEITDDNYIFDYNKKENKLTLEFYKGFENDIKDLIPQVIPVISDVAYNYNLLPPEYLAAEFLESTGTQYIAFTGLDVVEEATQIVEVQRTTTTGVPQCIFGFSWNTQQFIQGLNNALKWTNYQANVLDRCVLEHTVNTTTKIATFTYASSSTQLTCSNGPLTQWGLWSVVNMKQCDAPDLRVFGASLLWGGVKKFEFSPLIDDKGVPCMYDKISNQQFYNSGTGQFIVGMNMAQARKLGKLPASGGSLTVSLPNDYTGDMLITNAIANATSNGWTLTIQTYAPENSASEASAFGMPRIWVRKVQTENGSYVDNENNRYQVEWCVTMYTPDNSTPDQHGYEMFRNVESAVEYWGLSQWIDPEIENMLEQQIQ